MIIRKETMKDYSSVEKVITQAFLCAEHTDGNEAQLVAALRKSEAFIPELSLVAERNGEIIGHILLTKAHVQQVPVLALAPLAVSPNQQRKGVGKALVQQALQIAKQLGYDYAVVLGGSYYRHFGFIPASTLGILPPFDVPDEYFMAKELKSDAAELSGVMQYAPEFGIG